MQTGGRGGGDEGEKMPTAGLQLQLQLHRAAEWQTPATNLAAAMYSWNMVVLTQCSALLGSCFLAM